MGEPSGKTRLRRTLKNGRKISRKAGAGRKTHCLRAEGSHLRRNVPEGANVFLRGSVFYVILFEV